MKKVGIFSLALFILLFGLIQPVLASVSFTVSLPSELQSGIATVGTEYDFTININTGTDSRTSSKALITYDSVNLQFVSVTNGGFFDQITNTTASGGQFYITGTSSSAETGSGSFAVIRFKLLGTSGNSTFLCAASEVTPTSTPVPTSATSTPVPTSATSLVQCALACTYDAECVSGLSCINGMCLRSKCPESTNCICPTSVMPTSLPKTGSVWSMQTGAILAISLIALGLVGIIIL